MKNTYLIFTLLCLLAGCSSVPKETYKLKNIEFRKEKLNNIELKGEITLSARNESNSATAKTSIAKSDSLLMKISGPFGIVGAKLYSREDYYLFFDALKGKKYEGKPDAESFAKLIYVPMSYNDIVHLLRNETVFAPDKYKSASPNSNLFIYITDDYDDIVTVDSTTLTISRYQRQFKNDDDKYNLEVTYTNYEMVSGLYFPKIITIYYSKYDLKVTYEIDEIIVNPIFEQPFNFLSK